MIRKTNEGRNLSRHTNRYARSSRLNESISNRELESLSPEELYDLIIRALGFAENYLADFYAEYDPNSAVVSEDYDFVMEVRKSCAEICRVTGLY